VPARVVERDRETAAQEVEAGIAELARQARKPRVTPLEEIAGLLLDLRWRDLVDMGSEVEKTEGSDLAAKLWAWSHKVRGEKP